VAVFHGGDDDIECGEAFFEFDPGEAPAAGLVGAGGVFDEESLVSGGADVAEVGVDFFSTGGVEDFGMPQRKRQGESVQEFAAAMQRFSEQASAIELEDVEDEAGDGYAIRKKEVGFLSAEAFL
jgi:hypothetical protein